MVLITLESTNGDHFTIEQDLIIGASETIKNLVEDAGTDSPVPLPEITSEILAQVLSFCKNPSDYKFEELSQQVLFDVILAANYLDMKEFLDATCTTVANMIKGKTPEEIRATFGIVNDFTPEEIAKVKKENEWCEE